MISRFFRTLLLLLDGLLLILFLIGYTARHIPSHYAWGAELVATGLPYLSLLLVAATGITGLLHQWKLFAVHLVLVVLALVRFVPPERGRAPGPDDVTLLTFNTSRGGGARADEQGRAIAALIRAEQPDMVALQETKIEYHPARRSMQPDPRLVALVDSMDYRPIRVVGPKGPHYAIETGLPVLARFELLEQTQVVLRRSPLGNPRAQFIRTRFRWQGREAVHYNLHLQSFGIRKPWEDKRRSMLSPGFWKAYLRQYRDAYLIRASEMEQIRAMMDRETLPLIVSGDLNSTPHNRVYYGLARGMQDAFLVAGHGWGATYHAGFPVARIDHVLVSPEWQVVDAYVSQAPYSDHLPLVVRLRWRE